MQPKINKNQLKDIPSSKVIIEEFNASNSYLANIFVIYQGDVYRSLQNITPGPFDNTKWKIISSTVEFQQLQAQVDGLDSSLLSHTSNTLNPHSVTKEQVGLGNADNTSDANKPISTATQTAIDNEISRASTAESLLQGSIDTVSTALGSHTSNTSNPHSVTKAQVGLSNVDNTSDINKPISTATSTALSNLESDLENQIGTTNTNLSSHTLNTNNPHQTTKAQVGLGNVDNTSDANKPISTATQTALDNLESSLELQIENTNTNLSSHTLNTNNPHSVTKTQVGLGNVDNTSDANKPLSTAATEANEQLQTQITNNKDSIDTINELIPGTTTPLNQLADQAFVNSSIQSLAAVRVYKTSTQDNFDTRAVLLAATEFYDRSGDLYTPKTNDYTIVTADEGAPSPFTNGQTYWKYFDTGWGYDHGINETPFTAAQQAAIDSGATSSKISSYDSHLSNTSNPHSVTKAQVGLGNVDNTSDANKPISTATQSALDTINTNVSTVSGDLSSHTLNTNNPHQTTKAQVGLSNVDNTSDANKPISTATQSAIDDVSIALGSHTSNTLNPHSVTASQVGAYTKGEADTLLNNKVDKVSGKGLSTNDLTDTLKGNYDTAYSHSQTTGNPHGTTKSDVGLGNVDNTSDANKPISTATQTALNLKANDNAVVHIVGTETITGPKSFTEAITATGGFKDADVSTAVKLGDSSNTSLNTGNKTIIGGINEVVERTSGGGVAPLLIYLTNIVSTIEATYNQLSYILPTTETILNTIVNNNEVLIKSFLFDNPTDTTLIPAGNWIFNIYTYISATLLSTRLKIEVFKRTSIGTETTLFTVNSDDINLTSVGSIRLESFQNEFVVNATDYLGARVYANTTAPLDITVHLYLGDGYPSYVTTPLALRHDLLRDIKFASDNKSGALHITNAEETLYGIKHFNSSPTVPDPVADTDAANMKFVLEHGGGGATPLYAGQSFFGLFKALPSAAYIWGDADKQTLTNASTNYANLVANITNDVIPSGTEAEWDAAYAAHPDHGVAFWVYDAVNDIIIAPNIPRGYTITAAGSLANVGTVLQNAAPAIEGSLNNVSSALQNVYPNSTGVIKRTSYYTSGGKVGGSGVPPGLSDFILEFPESFGRDGSTRIRGDQIQMRVLFYVGAEISPQEASQITAAGVLADVAALNGLTGQGGATPMSDYVIDTYVSGTSWYRLYKSGWVEQGGRGKNTITLPIEMASSTYYCLATRQSSTADSQCSIVEVSATQISVKITTGTAAYWEVKGYAAV